VVIFIGIVKPETCHRAVDGTVKSSVFFSVPPQIYDFPSVTQEEGEASKLVCVSQGDPSPDLTFHKTGRTEVYHIGTNVCHIASTDPCCAFN